MAERKKSPRERQGMSPFVVGAIWIAILAVGSYFAFTKVNPFANPYELTGYFETANNLKPRSPVRIAGVEIGKVKKVEAINETGGAKVEMEIKKEGLPIHEDAELTIRPRIFLEGNFYVEVRPGSPSSPHLKSGKPIPATQTATPVQIEQVLTALQSDTRSDLQTFLKEYSKGLEGAGARGFNRSIKYWEPAYKNAAIANEATLGSDHARDLRRVLTGQQKVASALVSNEEALKDLVTNFNTTAGAFAREDVALEASIPALRDVLRVGSPALASLNDALPALRGFARDALPGVRSSGPTLRASLPFIKQARRLVSKAELRGLVADLRPTIPSLARLNARTIPFLEETRTISACTNEVLLPFAKEPIPDPDFPDQSGQPFYKQAPRSFVGLAGEGRTMDANGPFFRVLGGGGPTTTVSTGDDGTKLVGTSLFPILGLRPYKSPRPRYRPDLPCETQEPPNLAAPTGATDQAVNPNPRKNAKWNKLNSASSRGLKQVYEYARRKARGLPAVDPLQFDDAGERIEARKLGLVRGKSGSWITRAEKRKEERR